jgi:hypothetical protein
MKHYTLRIALLVSVFSGLLLLGFILLARTSEANDANRLTIGPLKPLTMWTEDLVLKSGDLSSGWLLDGRALDNEEGAPSHIFWFKNPPAEQAGSTLSDAFIVYTTTALAEQAYPHVRDKYFPPTAADKWKTMPELEFQDQANERKIACLSSSLYPMYKGTPLLECGAIARYQNVIVSVDGIVLLDQGLTLSDFRQMLEAVDRRIASVLAQQP